MTALTQRRFGPWIDTRWVCKLMQFIALLFVGAQVGVSYAHLMQMPGKAKLPIASYILVQNVLIHYKLGLGIIEYGALASILTALVLLVRQRRTWAAGSTALALGLLLAMVLIWAIGIEPINMQIATWTPTAFPADWPTYRDRWHMLHAIRLVLGTLSMSSLIASVLIAEPRAS